MTILKLSALAFAKLKQSVPRQLIAQCGFLKKKAVAIEKEKLMVQFLHQCIDEEVMPKYLQANLSNKLKKDDNFTNKHKEIITTDIAQRTATIEDLLVSLDNQKREFEPSILTTMEVILLHFVKPEVARIKEKNEKQLKSLIIMKRAKGNAQTKCDSVVNLTNKILTKSQIETLSLGMNMTWPNKIKNISVQVESELLIDKISKINNISNACIDQISTELKSHYGHYENRHIRDKVNKKTIQHLKNLRELGNETQIYIAKFDKGNGICLENRNSYLHKMRTLLDNKDRFKPYVMDKRVEKDPFIYCEENFNRKIADLFTSRKIDSEIKDAIRSTGSQPARLYGLPKVHKSRTNPPYRPILSMTNAYNTNLAKWLDKLLKPFLPQKFVIKDTFDFVKDIKELVLPENTHMVSFDVTSLFTNVPVSETIRFICNSIPISKIPVSKSTLDKLLNIACKNIVFSFNSDIYVQHEGMCMGSNLGPTMAAYAMHMIESKLKNMPLYYKRYVDDTFAIFKTREEADQFFDQLNRAHSEIKFTMEREENNSLTFLDVTVIKTGTSLQTKWHMKGTNTGTYLNKTACSPNAHKVAAMRSLIYRAHKICSKPQYFETAYQEIQNIFINNGYHFSYIDKIKERVLKPKERVENNENQNSIYFTLPYSKAHERQNKISIKKINNTLKDHNYKVKLAYTTFKSSFFFPNKDPVAKNLQSNIVYQFQCDQCSGPTYIGETTRHFSTRKQEHIHGVPKPTEVTKHAHPATDEQFTILYRTKHVLIAEALFYHSVPPEHRLNKYVPPYQLRLFNYQRDV